MLPADLQSGHTDLKFSFLAHLDSKHMVVSLVPVEMQGGWVYVSSVSLSVRGLMYINVLTNRPHTHSGLENSMEEVPLLNTSWVDQLYYMQFKASTSIVVD